MRSCYLPIPLLACPNSTHWYAVGRSVEGPCAAKKRPGNQVSSIMGQHAFQVGAPVFPDHLAWCGAGAAWQQAVAMFRQVKGLVMMGAKLPAAP